MRSDGEGEGGAGTDADGGQGVLGLGDVTVRAWRATSSVGVPRWHPVVVACRLRVACCLLLACCLLFACRLPDACCLLFACRFLVACRLACRFSSHVACFRVSLSSHIVSGWWCWAFAAARGAGRSSSSMGWPAHHSPGSTRRTWHGRSSRLLSGVRRRPGAANKVSEGGGDDDRVASSHSPAPTSRMWCGRSPRSLSCLHRPPGAAKEVSEVGGDDDGWPLTFPSAPPHTWHRRSACSLTCLHLRPLH